MEKFANLFTLIVVWRGCWPQRALFARAAWHPGAAAGRGRVMAPLAGGHVREGEALVAVGGVSTSGMQVQQVYELMRRQMEATSGTTITMQFAARV